MPSGSGGTASCRSSCPPSPRLAWLTILRWWLPHIDGKDANELFTSPVLENFLEVGTFWNGLQTLCEAVRIAAAQQYAQVHALRFRAQAEHAAQRGHAVAHALQAAAAARHAGGQAHAVVADIQQRQRATLALADAQTQLERGRLRMLHRIRRALLHQTVDGGARVFVQQARVAVQVGAVDDAGGGEQIADG